jgi:Arc/MetJ-type ribon-helix-helix transcriptional regulator
MVARGRSERSVTTVRLEAELHDGLRELFARDGITPSESVRRAVRAWLESKGINVPEARRPERKRAEGKRRK